MVLHPWISIIFPSDSVEVRKQNKTTTPAPNHFMAANNPETETESDRREGEIENGDELVDQKKSYGALVWRWFWFLKRQTWSRKMRYVDNARKKCNGRVK